MASVSIPEPTPLDLIAPLVLVELVVLLVLAVLAAVVAAVVPVVEETVAIAIS
jgi:hypothetical protein